MLNNIGITVLLKVLLLGNKIFYANTFQKKSFLPAVPYFCNAIKQSMTNNYQEEIQEHKEKDVRFNWVLSSRFFFYVNLFCILAFILGGCYKLYTKSYDGKPDLEVPDNTLYTPKYK